MHNPSIHNQRLIDKESARWHQQCIFVRAGDNVHFAGHPNHQVVGWILHLEHDGVTLSRGIGCWLNGSDARSEAPRPVGIELQFGFHPRFHFAHILFVYFTPDVISARRNCEKLVAVRNQFAIDCLNICQKSINRRPDLRALHLRLQLFSRFLE